MSIAGAASTTVFDHRAERLSLLAGLANVAAIFLTAFVVRSLSYESPLAFAIGGGIGAAIAFLLGAGPIYLLLRRRLIAPVLASGWITFVAVTERGALHSPIEVFFVPPFAVVVAAIVGAVAMAEYGLRRGAVTLLSRATS